MLATLQQALAGVRDPAEQTALGPVLRALSDRLSSQTLTTPGLVITAGAATTAKNGTACYALANGILRLLPINTNMAALSGTVTNATFNVFCFFIDQASNLTTVIGGAGATLAQVKFPQTPQGKAMLGFVVINPTGTGDFVGGTTALDNGTVVPNAAYINTLGAIDPSVLLGI